jgi:hypothetical protein
VFYLESKQSDKALRFGDVLSGFFASTPSIHKPPLSGDMSFSVEISNSPHYVLLSPCCSIADKVVLLTPLIPVRAAFFKNPYFAEDLTRINRLVDAERSLPPEAWQKMEADEKIRRLGIDPAYTFFELFIYEQHDLFPEYRLPRKEGDITTKHFMIDFRFAFRVNCNGVNSPEDSPLGAKVLQLTTESRHELRQKISYFYSRVPKEDMAVLV